MKARKSPRTSPAARPETDASRLVVAGAAACLIVAAGAMLALSFSRLAGIGLAGCGPGSPCAQAAASAWGRVPLIDWPVSHLGFAYFAALLVAWLFGRGRVSAALRAITRLGVLASVFFVWVMITQRLTCPYCFVAHAANLGFALFVEFGAPTSRVRWQTGLAAGAMACTSLVLAAAEWRLRGAAREQAEQLLAASTREIAQSAQTRPATTQHTRRGFTGRYRIGPDPAPIRIVVISDYQCGDCKLLEQQLRPLLAARTDVALSAKHFPFCSECNPYVERTLHGNACWAARAAEAAGMLGGAEGFFRMHHWLFDRGGSFTHAELAAALPTLGFDPRAFVAAMESPETLAHVRADVEEAVSLGLHFTPMIFINGVELRGWNAPNAVARAVEALAATNPPPRGPEYDRPAGPVEKVIADWRAQSIIDLPPDRSPHVLGRDGAAIRVLVFGDYQEAGTAVLDRVLRAEAARRDMQYAYRNFPLSKDCNPGLPQTLRPLSCLAARAAEAAARVAGGADTEPGAAAFWRMHAWLLEHPNELSEEMLRAAAVEQGLDAGALLSAMQSAQVQESIGEDAEAGNRLKLKGIPTLYLNGRYVPRWELPSGSVLPELLDAAGSTP